MNKLLSSLNWPTTIYFLIVHVGALTAPFYFTWSALAVFLVLSFLGGLGVTLGFHRLLTHRAFETHGWVRYVFAWLGTSAGEGGVIEWVATHRKHHKFSDTMNDPHSPRDGLPWAHLLWMVSPERSATLKDMCEHYTPDLMQDRMLRFINASFIGFHIVTAIALYLIGGYPWLAWGVFLRITWVLHTTWAINSLTHRFGYRNYPTRDDSTNILWLTPFTLGEANHNNHHAYPAAANHGHRWFEFDITYRVIQLLSLLGLAWNIVEALPTGLHPSFNVEGTKTGRWPG